MLHLVQSHLSKQDFDRLLEQLVYDDDIVLMNDGVYLSSAALLCPCRCHVMLTDSQMRGVGLTDGMLALDMDGFVTLSEQHSSSATW